MNLKEQVANLMSKQTFSTQKNAEYKNESILVLKELGIPEYSEFFEFYSTYYARDLRNRSGASPIVDSSPP